MKSRAELLDSMKESVRAIDVCKLLLSEMSQTVSEVIEETNDDLRNELHPGWTKADKKPMYMKDILICGMHGAYHVGYHDGFSFVTKRGQPITAIWWMYINPPGENNGSDKR